MRKLYRLLVLLYGILYLAGCAETSTGEIPSIPEKETEISWVEEAEESGIPVLKIRAYVWDGTGEKEILTELQLGEPVTVKYGGGGDCNIAMEFQFDGGLIGVVSENNMIQMSMGQKEAGPWDSGNSHENRTLGFYHQIAGKGHLSLYPLWGHHGSMTQEGVADVWGDYTSYDDLYAVEGTEYWLSVSASTFHSPDKPIIFARIRMIQHEDEMSAHMGGKFFASHFTAELVEYTISDTYKMMIE